MRVLGGFGASAPSNLSVFEDSNRRLVNSLTIAIEVVVKGVITTSSK